MTIPFSPQMINGSSPNLRTTTDKEALTPKAEHLVITTAKDLGHQDPPHLDKIWLQTVVGKRAAKGKMLVRFLTPMTKHAIIIHKKAQLHESIFCA